jgi:transcriptional regulator with XRE-family HTH domain
MGKYRLTGKVPIGQNHGMNLFSYLRDRKITATALALRLGVSVSTVTRIRDGQRRPSLHRALQIQAVTDGAVTVADLGAMPQIICPLGETATHNSGTPPEPAP